MKQEDKELLLKDLCARLPYGVKGLAYIVGEPCNTNTNIVGIINKSIVTNYESPMLDLIHLDSKDITIKPYLRPMSSMTEEEKKELGNFVAASMFASRNKNPLSQLTRETLYGDFFNKRHIDYRGLIEKGLALEAPEDMYK